MGTNTGEINPVARDVWIQPEPQKKETQVIPPVAKTKGGTAEKVSDERKDNDNSSVAQQKNEKLVQQLQAALDEALNVQLNFQLDNQTHEMVVQVVDRQSGQVIRQIPQQGLNNLREKLEELRGIIFDHSI